MNDLPMRPTKTDHILALGRGLLRPSVVMLFGGAVVYLSIVGKPIPEILGALVSMTVGYYFGARTAEKAHDAPAAPPPAPLLPMIPMLPPAVQQAIDAVLAPPAEPVTEEELAPDEGRTSV